MLPTPKTEEVEDSMQLIAQVDIKLEGELRFDFDLNCVKGYEKKKSIIAILANNSDFIASLINSANSVGSEPILTSPYSVAVGKRQSDCAKTRLYDRRRPVSLRLP